MSKQVPFQLGKGCRRVSPMEMTNMMVAGLEKMAVDLDETEFKRGISISDPSIARFLAMSAAWKGFRGSRSLIGKVWDLVYEPIANWYYEHTHLCGRGVEISDDDRLTGASFITVPKGTASIQMLYGPIAAEPTIRENPAIRLPVQTEYARHYQRLRYRLACGREVSVEGCYVSPSTLGFLEGSMEHIRDKIINMLPGRVREQFPGISGVFIKPVPKGELPTYTFMVDLECYEPVSDPSNDMSSLIVCWLGDDIDTSLPELIGREICSVEWDRYAVDGCI